MKRIFPGITKMQASSIKRINIERESIAGSEGHKSKLRLYAIQCDKYNPESRSRNDASDENIFISNH